MPLQTLEIGTLKRQIHLLKERCCLKIVLRPLRCSSKCECISIFIRIKEGAFASARILPVFGSRTMTCPESAWNRSVTSSKMVSTCFWMTRSRVRTRCSIFCIFNTRGINSFPSHHFHCESSRLFPKEDDEIFPQYHIVLCLLDSRSRWFGEASVFFWIISPVFGNQHNSTKIVGMGSFLSFFSEFPASDCWWVSSEAVCISFFFRNFWDEFYFKPNIQYGKIFFAPKRFVISSSENTNKRTQCWRIRARSCLRYFCGIGHKECFSGDRNSGNFRPSTASKRFIGNITCE